METLDDVIAAALADEAQYAPDPDDVLARLFEPNRAPAATRNDTQRSWLAPAGLAAALALIVSGGVWWASHQTGLQPSNAPDPAPTEPAVTTPPAQFGANQGRLPGYVELSAGSVHLELDANQGAGSDWSNDWTINCPESQLAAEQPGDVACAGPDGDLPRFEAAVSFGEGVVPPESPTLRYTSDVERARHDIVLGRLTFAGHPSWTSTVAAKVRYDCGSGCERWVDRRILVVSFPGYDRQVTLMAPSWTQAYWLADFIYIQTDN